MLKSRKVSFLAYALLFLTIGATLLWPQKAVATTGVPALISFEGKIVKSDGTNIPDGTYNMEFKIYSGTSNTGVGDTLLFTEDWLVGSTQGGVAFTSGTYAKNIGSAGVGSGDSVALSSLNFNQYPLWISVQIGNTSSCTITTTFQSNCGGDGEMTPYIQMTSTPYALNSNELGGLTASQFGQLAANNTWTGTNKIQPSISTTAFSVMNASNADFTVDTSGNNVIIGKAGAQTAVLELANATGTNVVGLQAGASTAAYTLTLPTTAPSTNQCLAAGPSTATSLVFTNCTTGTFLAKNSTDTSSAAVTTGNFLYAFTNSSSGVTSGVLKLDNGTNTNDTLYVTTSGNPASGQALIVANETNASPSGNLLDLQVSASSKFSVNVAGRAYATTTSSAATAAYGFQGDTGTGMTTLASGVLALTANGTEKLRARSYGVGIGGIDPNSVLTVNGTGVAGTAINVMGSNATDAPGITTQNAGSTATMFVSGATNQWLTGTNQNDSGIAFSGGNFDVGTHNQVYNFQISPTGATTLRNTSNSTTAFQIQNSNGVAVLAADTTTNTLNVAGNINIAQVAAPSSAPTLNAYVASGVLTGTYYYVVSYVTASGNSGYGPVSAAMTPSAQNVTLNIPVSPSSLVTARSIYRSTSYSGPFNLVGTVNDNVTTTFTDANTSPTTTAQDYNTTGVLQYAGNNVLIADTVNGNDNTAVGYQALQNNATAINNSAFGTSALRNDTTGFANTAVGDVAAANTTTGSDNVALGVNTFTANTTGSYNTGLGTFSLNSNTTGSYDSALGYQAGSTDSGGQFSTTATLQNATAIGAYAQVQSNNTIVLGSVDTPTITVVGATEGSVNGSGTATGNPFQVNPLAYNTGTACTTATSAGTTCAAGAFLYGTGTTWTAAMVGDQIIFADGTTANITAYTSATALSLDRSITEASTTYYRIHQIGLQVTTAGSIGIGTTAPTEEMEVYKDVAGSDNSILVQNDAAGQGAYLKATANSNFADVMLNGTGQMWIAGEWGSTAFAVQDYTHTLTPFVVTPSSANDSIYINSVGVGIGTTNVINKLTVVGDGTGLTQIGGSTGCGGNYVAITLGQTATTSGCNNYNILGSPTDPNLYLNAPSTGCVDVRVSNGNIQQNCASAITLSEPTTITAPSGGGTVDLSVNGRIQTYDGTGQGGVWTRNTEFVGDDGGNTGLYNSGWGLYVNTGQAVTIANTISSANNAGKFYIAGGNWYMGYIAGGDIGLYANGTTQIQTGVSGASTSLYLGNGGGGDYIYDNSNASGTGTVLCKASGGQIVIASSVCANPSSIAYKQNVVPLVNQTGVDPLSIIQQLTPVSFDWKASTGYTAEDGGSHDFGFIAQAVNPILPELVHTDANGTITGLNYFGFIPFAIGAAQEEQQEIVANQNTLSAMAQSLQSASLTITGDGSIQGALSAGSLNVSGDTSLNNLTVTGAATVASLTVSGDANILGNLTVNGHIITGGGTPTVQLQSAAGTNASVFVDGNDTSGTITITTGEAYQPPKNGNPAVPAPMSGDEASLTFSSPFGATPRVIITGNDRKSATLQVYPDQQSATGFSLGINQIPEPNTTYTFNYFVVQ